EEKHPKTDEEWSTYRNAAAVLIESGNLLMLDGRAQDQDDWMKTSRGMSDAAATVLEAAEAKDVEAYFNAGGALYEACTACHSKYLVARTRISVDRRRIPPC
ncbi:MAG: cytochrome c, partial [Gammaproteobacteria bacterium]|nr:cytochrome c [Gammaproteobacteria bacterium]